MKITHSLVVNIHDGAHIVQSSTGFRAPFFANIHFTVKLLLQKKSPKAYSKSGCSLDGFMDEIVATPARGIYFFRLCNRFLEYFLPYLLSNRTRFQRCAVLTVV